MEITKIESPIDEFIDILLKKNTINDFLFEKKYIKIHISNVEPVDYLYRRMYEEIFLRRDRYFISSIPEDGRVVMNLSISEAIDFIKAALPPVFKPRETEAYKSLADIRETLDAFLCNENKSQYNYLSLFKKCTGLNYFETNINYDLDRNTVLRKFEPTKPIIDIISTNVSYDNLYDGIEGDELEDFEGTLYREPTGTKIQFVYNCIKKSELEYVYKIINEANYYYLNGAIQVHILNMFHREFNGYFVEIYIDNFDSEICKTLYDIYKLSYKGILGK